MMMEHHIVRRWTCAILVLAATCWVSEAAFAQVVGDPAPVPPKTGGLAGMYYNNTGNNAAGLGPPPLPPPGSPIGTANNGLSVLFLSRIDGPVSFDFQATPPPGVNNTPTPADHFTVVWEGFVIAPANGSLSFATRADDGMRLWVNDLTANPPPINMWAQGGERQSNTVTLTGLTLGQKIPVRFEMYENEGGAVGRLWWEAAGGATPDVAIPAANLAPPDGPAAPTGLTAVATPGATAQVALNWNAPAGATGYILSRSVNGGPMQVYQLLTTNAYNDTAVAFGTQYTYLVQATSTGGQAIGTASGTVSVTPPTISASPLTGLQTSETGATAPFNLILNVALAFGQTVTFTLTSSEPLEGFVGGGGQASAASITFDVTPPTAAGYPAGFQIPITVTGRDDSIADPNNAYQIDITATSTQANLAGQTIPSVQLINVDDDVPGIFINQTAGLVTSESGGTASFTVSLATQPSAPVTMTLTSSNTSEGTVSTATVTFAVTAGAPNGWNFPQQVTLMGVDDSVLDFQVPYTIVTGDLQSADGNYSGMTVVDISAVNLDNEAIPTLPTVWGGGSGGCGATGLEVGILLALAALCRRRRSTK